MEGRDKGKIGTVRSTDKVRSELTVEGLNKVCWDSAFAAWSHSGYIVLAELLDLAKVCKATATNIDGGI